VTGPGLERLSKLSDLASLDLSDAPVTDAGLQSLSTLTRLATLDLSRTQIGGAGLAHVARLVQLHRLDLEGTKVSDAGLAHLGNLSRLTYLDLSETKVTNQGLRPLGSLAGLAMLWLPESIVDDGQLQMLCRAIPLCWIYRGPGRKGVRGANFYTVDELRACADRLEAQSNDPSKQNDSERLRAHAKEMRRLADWEDKRRRRTWFAR
jgi:hypothetical protein